MVKKLRIRKLHKNLLIAKKVEYNREKKQFEDVYYTLNMLDDPQPNKRKFIIQDTAKRMHYETNDFMDALFKFAETVADDEENKGRRKRTAEEPFYEDLFRN